ncbi:MAG: Holliday junction branch migration DNA helicase RuvB [Alphaproteobacteria bacterium]|nr:Holliday junction branch migration DNA helicase RuvB [Alphaproteobacteria bacterium]
MSRLLSGEAGPDEAADLGPSRPADAQDRALRPQSLVEFVGQEQAKANLRVFIDGARGRGEALDHVLLFGPPGLGKTTLAQIIARELGVGFRATSGPVLAKAGDLAAILTNLEPRDVLFIDEIHRLAPHVEEILYPAMEDHALDLVIGEGPSARSVRIELSPFTLVAATTRAGLLATPLRDRFGIPVRLDFYTTEELGRVVAQAGRKLGLDLAEDGAREIAGRARGTPRVAGRLLRRVRDFAAAEGATRLDGACAARGLARLEVDEMGLDALDRRYLRALIDLYGGGPAGVETLSHAVAEARDAVEDVIEPFLLQQGFIQRTPRGRVACARAYAHLGLAPPAGPPEASQSRLFDDDDGV